MSFERKRRQCWYITKDDFCSIGNHVFWTPRIIREGEEGWRESGLLWDCKDFEAAKAVCAQRNFAIGLTEVDVQVLVGMSMFPNAREDELREVWSKSANRPENATAFGLTIKVDDESRSWKGKLPFGRKRRGYRG